MGVVFTRLLAGGLAGLGAWALMEPRAPIDLNSVTWGGWERSLIMLFGTLVGLAVGGLEGWSRGGARHVTRSLILGGFFGAVGATLGYAIGGGIATSLFGPSWPTLGALPVRILGRTVVIALLGAFVGLGVGGSQLSWPRAVQGLIGGLLGGAIGGMVFDILGTLVGQFIITARDQTTGEVGGPGRGVAFTLTGAMIGAMIGLVSRLARRAWLRLELGRNEGREWAIESPRTNVGRDERADIPLFGDPNVAPLHFVIDRQGPRFFLQDGGSPGGTFLEGQRVVGPAMLQHGHRITAGGLTLTFRERGGGSVANATPIFVPVPQAPVSNVTQAYAAPVPTSMPGPFAPGPVLFALDGPAAGVRYAVDRPLEIGREGAGIALSGDGQASRRHALVRPGPAGVEVEDLGSTNGTWVNGVRVPRAPLRPGDTLKVGGTTFRLE